MEEAEIFVYLSRTYGWRRTDGPSKGVHSHAEGNWFQVYVKGDGPEMSWDDILEDIMDQLDMVRSDKTIAKAKRLYNEWAGLETRLIQEKERKAHDKKMKAELTVDNRSDSEKLYEDAFDILSGVGYNKIPGSIPFGIATYLMVTFHENQMKKKEEKIKEFRDCDHKGTTISWGPDNDKCTKCDLTWSV